MRKIILLTLFLSIVNLLRGQDYSANVAAGAWYRIAENSGNRANAEFTLRDLISSGGHSTLNFRLGISYNNLPGVSFTVLNHSYYMQPTFTKVRILSKGTYDPQYVEVYVVRSGSVNYSIYDNLQNTGWTAINWTPGSQPAGYTVTEYNVNNLFVVGDTQNRLTINRGGNVGIGTSTPTEKLSVDGTILAKEVRVSTESSDWPDFVFEDNYKLNELSEVEAFIKANKHLPAIPSAAEMEEAGVNLAEMNKLLLMKVEELTLYSIGLEKELKKCLKDIDAKIQMLDSVETRLETIETILLKVL